MNELQDKALVSLSRAFYKCKKADLCFQGMDGELLAFDANEYFKLTKIDSICDQQYVEDGNQGVTINTHHCYKDSAGW